MLRNVISRASSTLVAAMLMIFAVSDLHAAPAGEANTVVLKDFHFSPMSLSVPAGTTVIWRNLDEEPHTVASDSGLFRSGGLDQNDSFTFTFDRPGTYRFICSIHPSMMGTIIVK